MKNIGIILLFIILPAFLYWEFASSSNIFVQKDWLVRNYPFRGLATEMLKNGILPLWNPYILCGAPLFADIDLGIGYPLNILNLFMPLARALKWNYLLHISLSGIFMYLLLRVFNLACFGAIIGAITFMLGGYMQSFIPIPDLWMDAVYIPLIFLFFQLGLNHERGIYVILGGIALALQLLCGVPQLVYYTLFALFLFAIYHCLIRTTTLRSTPLLYFMGMAVIGFSLSAFQLIPTYEYYLLSAKYLFRTTQDTYTLGAMLPHAILFFIGVADPYTSGFIGISGLLLALIGIICHKGKLKFFFAGLCLLVLVSVFEITGFYKILFHIPGFNMFSSIHRFVVIYAFGISVLAGFGGDILTKIMGANTRGLKKSISISIFILGCILIATFSLNYFLKDRIIDYGQRFIEKNVFRQPGHPLPITYYYEKFEHLRKALLKILSISILPVIGTFIIIALRRTSPISKLLFQTAFICILLLELYGYWNRISWKLVNPDDYYSEREVISFIKNDNSIYRVFGLDNSGRYHFDYENSRKMNELLTPNLSTVHHIQDPQGMDNVSVRNYWKLFELINRKKYPLEDVYTYDQFYLLAITNPGHGLIDLLNVKYLSTYSPLAKNDHWKLVYNKGIKVYQNTKVMPRAFVAYKYVVPENENTLLRLLDDSLFNMRETVILDKDIAMALGPASSNKVEIKKYSPLEVKIDVYTKERGILVLGDSFYPGWRAEVDGHYVKIRRAYSVFRAIPVEKGNHQVTFSYLPLSFIGGCFISITTFFITTLELLRRLLP